MYRVDAECSRPDHSENTATAARSGSFELLEDTPRLVPHEGLRHLRVPRRGADVRVPEEFLKGGQATTCRKPAHGVGVAATVRVEVLDPRQPAHEAREAAGIGSL